MLFLPTEGLYAEVLRRPGLVEPLQREYRVDVAGPTTLLGAAEQPADGLPHAGDRAALERGVEMLGAVKTEFGKFGDVLGRPRRSSTEARRHRQGRVRTREIERKLHDVEALPDAEADRC